MNNLKKHTQLAGSIILLLMSWYFFIFQVGLFSLVLTPFDDVAPEFKQMGSWQVTVSDFFQYNAKIYLFFALCATSIVLFILVLLRNKEKSKPRLILNFALLHFLLFACDVVIFIVLSIYTHYVPAGAPHFSVFLVLYFIVSFAALFWLQSKNYLSRFESRV